jgi:hypothetical protein
LNPSEKRGLRRNLALILLAAALILAAAFVLLLPAIKERFPSKTALKYRTEPTYQQIDERDPQTLSSITVSHLDGETYTLVHQNGTLMLETDGGEPEAVSAACAKDFLKYATEITVEDIVAEDAGEVQDNLSDMGLDPPQIKVDVAYSDGSAVTLYLGYNQPSMSYHYFQWSGDSAVYLCNSGVYETFECTADMLLSITQPSVVSSLIERVSIKRGDEEPIVCVFAASGEDAVSGTLKSPFAYPMSAEAAETLLGALENFRLGARLKPVTDENRAMYGLDAPEAVVEITQREGLYSLTDAQGVLQSYPLAPSDITLTIGGPDGDFFRYCEYEGTCYRVSAFLAAAFLKADAMDYLTLNPADMGAEPIRSIVVQTGSGTLDIRAEYTERVLPNNELETDETGNVVYAVDATLNGEPISAEAFGALVERLRQMAVSGALETISEPGGAPQWQTTLTTAQGKSRALAAYPMDAFQDVLAVDGVAVHYISKEALDIALGEFAALAEPTVTP